MKIFFILFYNLLLYPLLVLAGLIGSLFNRKLREGIKGKFQAIAVLRDFFKDGPKPNTFWFHSASHGEYLQAKPVIAGLKEIEPRFTIIASFFSPSGYNNVNDPNIDLKVYIPFDFIWSVRRMLKIARPRKLIFAAYDIWPNLIWVAAHRKIPTALFAAHFIKGTSKLQPVIRSFYRAVYTSISSIYTVGKDDYLRVQRIIGIPYLPLIRVLGNPRYDEVKKQSDQFTRERTISVLLRERRLIVGSVWPEDMAVILEPILTLLQEYPDLKLLWVPHEPSEKFVEASIDAFRSQGFSVELYKSRKILTIPDTKVVVVTAMGVLSKLYWQGQFAYVGGGFSTGVHNVMEPAIARLPVLFGPRNENSPEAGELLASGGGRTISTGEEFYTGMTSLLDDKNEFLAASYAATEVIHNNLGSATRVVRGVLRD